MKSILINMTDENRCKLLLLLLLCALLFIKLFTDQFRPKRKIHDFLEQSVEWSDFF
jgi:hypothetical protein